MVWKVGGKEFEDERGVYVSIDGGLSAAIAESGIRDRSARGTRKRERRNSLFSSFSSSSAVI
jgi:hypothetical protein